MGGIGDPLPVRMSDGDFKALDPEDFRMQAHRLVDFIADYFNNIEALPVLSNVVPGFLRNQLPPTAPSKPEPLNMILRDVQDLIIPGMTHWASPSFFAYFPATTSTAALLGEMLCSMFNVAGFTWVASPSASELETTVVDWMGKLLNLPSSFTISGTGGGVLLSSTSEAILCTLVSARDRALAAGATVGKLVAYGSDQTHSTFTKACRIAGILPPNIRTIVTSADTEFAISPASLRRAMEADAGAGLVPFYVCATVGTTSTTAVDPVGEVAEVAEAFGAWIHVDAAYAGSACICPEFRHYLDGVERSDSVSMSPHKWLLSGLDCCCLWVKWADLFTKSLSVDGDYIRNKYSEAHSVVDYKDWQIGFSRRFRAMRMWVILRSYGSDNLQAHIRAHVDMAKMFEGFIREDPRFEVLVPRKFGLVCFRLGPNSGPVDELDRINETLLKAVNKAGSVYLTHTRVGAMYVLRCVVGTAMTEARHVVAAWQLLKEEADALLGNLMSPLPPFHRSSLLT